MTHTKGPWHRNIAPATKYSTIYAGSNTHICHLVNGGLTELEVESNCNLIAAAPELLEALTYMVSDHKELSEGTLNFARNALQKARGVK